MAGLQPYFVYVIENPRKRRYIGFSESPTARLGQHNAGVSKWTSKFRPWRLIWVSGALSMGEARKLENRLKRQKGGHGLELLLMQNGRFLETPSGS